LTFASRRPAGAKARPTTPDATLNRSKQPFRIEFDDALLRGEAGTPTAAAPASAAPPNAAPAAAAPVQRANPTPIVTLETKRSESVSEDTRREPQIAVPEAPRARTDATPVVTADAPAKKPRKGKAALLRSARDDNDFAEDRTQPSFARTAARIVVVPLYIAVGLVSIGIIGLFVKDLLGL
jgi:hypothetical protein